MIVPSDHQWADCGAVEVSVLENLAASFETHAVADAVRLLKTSHKAALVLGGQALSERGLRTAACIRAATGCDLLANTVPSYIERGVGLPDVNRVPYFPDWALPVLSKYEAVVLAGAREPVAFFGYKGLPSRLLRDATHKVALAGENQDALAALESLADALKAQAPGTSASGGGVRRPAIPQGRIDPRKGLS